MRRNLKFYLAGLAPIFVLVVLAGALAAASAASLSPTMKKAVAAANKEGSLKLSWGRSTLGGERGAKRAEREMSKLFGTTFRVTFSPGRSMPAIGFKMLAEKKAGRVSLSDVYIGALAQVTTLKKRGLFATVPFTKLLPGRITSDIVEGDGTLIRVAGSLAGVTYNPKLAPMKPKTLMDFLRPEWKGKIATTPYLANFDFLAANDVWGPEKALDYARKLSKQVTGLIRCPEGQRISSGEYLALVLDCGGLDAFNRIAKGAPLAQLIPADFAKISYYYFGLPQHAANPNAAKVYMAYMVSKEGQKLAWDTWKADVPSLPGSMMVNRINKIKKQGINLREYDFAWWIAHPEMRAAKKEMRNILIKSRQKKK